MIRIEDITEDAIFDRVESLPAPLQEALNSETNFHIVEEVCKAHHLTDPEKIISVKQVVGLVIMGFLHDYDLKDETNRLVELNNPQLAESITEALQAKVFSPLKADLDKNYRPLPSAPAPMPVERQKGRGPAPERVRYGAGKNQVPVPLGAIGTMGDIVRPSSGSVPKPAVGTHVTVAPPVAQKQVIPPSPFVIHKEEEFMPRKSKEGFRLTIPLPPGKRQEAGSQKQVPPVAARIEIGVMSPQIPKKPVIARTEMEAPRVVHYSQFKTPVAVPAAPGSKPAPVPLGQIGMQKPEAPHQDKFSTGQASSQKQEFRPVSVPPVFPKQEVKLPPLPPMPSPFPKKAEVIVPIPAKPPLPPPKL